MAQTEFANLPLVRVKWPNDPVPTIKFPRHSTPKAIFDHEDCSESVWLMFRELHCTMLALDGFGGSWSREPNFWYPREKHRCEMLGGGNRFERLKPWKIVMAYDTTSHSPHMIYHVIHSDAGKDGVISKSELEVLVKTMKGRMRESEYFTHFAPVSSIHGIMTPPK